MLPPQYKEPGSPSSNLIAVAKTVVTTPAMTTYHMQFIPTLLWLVVKTHFSKKLKKKDRGLLNKVKEKLNKENLKKE